MDERNERITYNDKSIIETILSGDKEKMSAKFEELVAEAKKCGAYNPYKPESEKQK